MDLKDMDVYICRSMWKRCCYSFKNRYIIFFHASINIIWVRDTYPRV